ncbi:hypothetical protein IWQ61_005818 [Dispira simplex]|nr:hypothetical protein IWQ61_005818 [Dispira simplex]
MHIYTLTALVCVLGAFSLPCKSAEFSERHPYRRQKSGSACNGYKELCDKSYADVAYLTTHNSYAYTKGVASNQNKDINDQLNDGVRALMLDFQKFSNNGTGTDNIHVCHSSCSIMDAGTAQKVLHDITDFMKRNPNEVITIILENGAKFSASDIISVFQAAGLDKYAWEQPTNQQTWPKLQNMIDQNKRLVVFSTDVEQTQWLLPEFTYVWETPWEVQIGSSFSCQVDRPSIAPYGALQVLNHFAYKSQQIASVSFQTAAVDQIAQTNSLSSLQVHHQQCESIYATLNAPSNSATETTIPNFVTVDFYDQGDAGRFVAQLNNLTYIVPKSSSKTSSGVPRVAKGVFTFSQWLIVWAVVGGSTWAL